MEPQTSGPSVRNNAIFKMMCGTAQVSGVLASVTTSETIMSPARINLCCLMQCEARHRLVMTDFWSVTCSPALPGHLSTKNMWKICARLPVTCQHSAWPGQELGSSQSQSWQLEISHSLVTKLSHTPRSQEGERWTSNTRIVINWFQLPSNEF